jgi:Kef-type K+ transport system membrane component KefB
MALAHMIPELDRKGLREFGLVTGAAVVALFGLFFPWMLGLDWPLWPWAIAAPLWLLALIHPSWLRGIYRVWMRLGLLSNRVMTPLLLGIVFFVMLSPMAMVRRLMGKDSMQRALDPNRDSYRVQSTRSPREKLERPF